MSASCPVAESAKQSQPIKALAASYAWSHLFIHLYRAQHIILEGFILIWMTEMNFGCGLNSFPWKVSHAGHNKFKHECSNIQFRLHSVSPSLRRLFCRISASTSKHFGNNLCSLQQWQAWVFYETHFCVRGSSRHSTCWSGLFHLNWFYEIFSPCALLDIFCLFYVLVDGMIYREWSEDFISICPVFSSL